MRGGCLVDCDVHPAVPSIDALFPYLPDHWVDFVVEIGSPSLEPDSYPSGASLSARPGSRPATGAPPGSDPELLYEHLDAWGAEIAILNCLYGVHLLHNPDWAAAMARGVNDWLAAEWLARDDRLRASILVSLQAPDLAVEEIERLGSHPGFVQVLLPAQTELLLGRRHFWRVFEAAERNRLPVAIHAGGGTGNPPTPVGWPSTYLEWYVDQAQALQSQLISLVAEGVFTRFPGLRVVLAEGGFSWLPSLMWRFDKNWRGMRREVPWLDRAPSEIVRDHVRLTTQPADEPPDPGELLAILEQLGSDELLLFSTDYPHWHFAEPSQSLPAPLPPELERKIRSENARQLYGLDGGGHTAPGPRIELRPAATFTAPAGPVEEGLVDADIHNVVPALAALAPYLPSRWLRHAETIGTRTHQGFASGYAYPFLTEQVARADAWPPSGLPPGSDLGFMREQLLDAWKLDYGVLNCLFYAGGQLNGGFAAALSRAVNDWQVADWLEPEPRLRASIVVPYEDGELAAAEIDRVGDVPGFVQIVLLHRTLEPLGKRRYWPIYEAAERHGLPVGIHFGETGGNAITSSGWPSYYIEHHTGAAQSFQAQLVSLVCEGVFERFPGLRVVLIEGGFAWLPPLMWRLDTHWRRLREEVPWLERAPSEIVREHVWTTTQPIEEPENPRHLIETFAHFGADERVLFATDYPHWDFDAPDRALPRELPAELRRRIRSENARALYALA